VGPIILEDQETNFEYSNEVKYLFSISGS